MGKSDGKDLLRASDIQQLLICQTLGTCKNKNMIQTQLKFAKKKHEKVLYELHYSIKQ